MDLTKILLVDDHVVVREGLRLFLEATGHYHIVADAGDGHAAVLMAELHSPDIVIMDLEMPRLDGIEATRQILNNGISASILILSMHANRSDVIKALQVGARGYIHKSSVTSEVVSAVETIMAGDYYFSPKFSIDTEMMMTAASTETRQSPASLID